MGQGKNDYGDGSILYELFIAPGVKFCPTIFEAGKLEKQTIQGLWDVDRLLDPKQNFDFLKGEALSGKFPTKLTLNFWSLCWGSIKSQQLWRFS